MELQNEETVHYEVEKVQPIFNARICLKGDQIPGRQITTVKALTEYLTDEMSVYATEVFMVVALDVNCRVLSTAVLGVGGINYVNPDIASVAKVALLSNAQAVFLAHNHPGGTCRPSNEDITATSQIKRALALFDIGVYDHVIVCSDGNSYSMKQHGDI